MYNLIFGPNDGSNALDNYIADVFPAGVKNVNDEDVLNVGERLFDRIFRQDIEKISTDQQRSQPITLETAN